MMKFRKIGSGHWRAALRCAAPVLLLVTGCGGDRSPGRDMRVLLLTAAGIVGAVESGPGEQVVDGLDFGSTDPHAALGQALRARDGGGALGRELADRGFSVGAFGVLELPGWVRDGAVVRPPAASIDDALRWMRSSREERVFAHVHLSGSLRLDVYRSGLQALAAEGTLVGVVQLPSQLPSGSGTTGRAVWFFEREGPFGPGPGGAPGVSGVRDTVLRLQSGAVGDTDPGLHLVRRR